MKIILYKNIYLKRIIILFLVVLISFNYIFIQTSEAVATLAAVWGGAVVAKQVLAMVVALAGLGITIATQEQAYSLYEDLKINNPALLQKMISVQPQIWTGAYNEVIQDLQDIKTGVVTWLTGLFGTLVVGQNTNTTTITETIGDITFNTFSSTGFHYIYGHGKALKIEYIATETYYNGQRKYTIKYPKLDGGVFSKNVWKTIENPTHTIGVKIINGDTLLYGEKIDNSTITSDISYSINTNTEFLKDISIIPKTHSITISPNAAALNPEWDPENDRKYPVPPLLLPKYPEIPIKEVTTPTGGKQLIYEGNIEEYLEDITNEKSWEYLDKYLKGQEKTTILTPTGTGSLVVGGTITDGLPYPYPNTDAPVDIPTGIGGITGLLQGLTNWLSNIVNTISDIFKIPDESNKVDLDFSPLSSLTISDKFPFSLPWDIADTIGLLVSPPAPPSWEINLLGNKLEIDFTVFDQWAMISRTFFTIIFIAGLIILTRRFLG